MPRSRSRSPRTFRDANRPPRERPRSRDDDERERQRREAETRRRRSRSHDDWRKRRDIELDVHSGSGREREQERERARERPPRRRRDEHERKDREDRGGRSRRDDYVPPPIESGSRPGDGTGDDLPPPQEKQKPNFSTTGLLAAASNTLNDVALKYAEPADARKPPPHPAWKLFVFKDSDIVDTIELSTRSCWLVGRDRAVADLPVDHPSCSKQHAVLQWRYVVKTDKNGERKGRVRLYLMDLESANGTRLGEVEVEGGRFVEVLEGDLVRFGGSTREYVVMVEKD